MRGRCIVVAVLAVTLLLCLAGCGGGGDDGSETPANHTVNPVRCDLFPQQCI